MVSSPLEVFTSLHHDNNHYLYTWFLQILGTDQPWAVYRLPSVLAGIGAVFVAGLIGGRGGRAEATTGMLLVALSYLQIYYASEARGYGCAIFFALLSFWLLSRSLQAVRPLNDLAFALAAILQLGGETTAQETTGSTTGGTGAEGSSTSTS